MSSFEYVMVIIAIIMGFGITTLLKGTVESMRSESTLTPGLLHSVWIVSLLVQQVGLWAVRWNGERREGWPALVLLAFLLAPILLYTQAELLFPRGGRVVKLTEYFIENRRPFFTLMILGYLGGAFGPFIFYEGATPVFEGASVLSGLASFAVLIIVSLALMFSKSVRLHTSFAVAYLGFLLLHLGFVRVG